MVGSSKRRRAAWGDITVRWPCAIDRGKSYRCRAPLGRDPCFCRISYLRALGPTPPPTCRSGWDTRVVSGCTCLPSKRPRPWSASTGNAQKWLRWPPLSRPRKQPSVRRKPCASQLRGARGATSRTRRSTCEPGNTSVRRPRPL